jgi:capsular polysaccharide biosynthesis protein
MDSQSNTSFLESKRVKEINLKDHFVVIKKRLWILLIITLITTSIGVMKNTFLTMPLYQSSTRMIIGADTELMKTLQVLIRDSTVLQKVTNDLGLNRSPEGLAQQISVGSVDGSQVVSINVVDIDPVMAANIANSTAEIFKSEAANIMNFNNIKLLTEAKINQYPINSDQNSTIIIAFLMGVIVGIGMIYFLDSLDDSIKSGDDIENFLGLPVLGSVSKMNKRNMKKKNNKLINMELRGETIGS